MRRAAALVLVLAAAISIPPPVALGQSQAEVDAARADARRAEAELNAAAAELVAAEFVESEVESTLLDTVERFDRAAADLWTVGHRNLAVRAELDQLEAEVVELRTAAGAAAVAAYQTAAVGRTAMWLSDSYHGAAVVSEALDEHVDLAIGFMDRLRERRGTLEAARAELGDQEGELRGLRDGLAVAEVSLAEELGIAQEILAAALEQVAAADESYQAALDRVELEERRLAALTGVEHWRPLVQRYFPPGRVGEALEVMHCESRGNPDATHPESGAAGLFQFLEGTWAFASANAGFPGASRYAPEPNIAAAAWLVHYSITINHPRGAWGHWSCQPAPRPGQVDPPSP